MYDTHPLSWLIPSISACSSSHGVYSVAVVLTVLWVKSHRLHGIGLPRIILVVGCVPPSTVIESYRLSIPMPWMISGPLLPARYGVVPVSVGESIHTGRLRNVQVSKVLSVGLCLSWVLAAVVMIHQNVAQSLSVHWDTAKKCEDNIVRRDTSIDLLHYVGVSSVSRIAVSFGISESSQYTN